MVVGHEGAGTGRAPTMQAAARARLKAGPKPLVWRRKRAPVSVGVGYSSEGGVTSLDLADFELLRVVLDTATRASVRPTDREISSVIAPDNSIRTFKPRDQRRPLSSACERTKGRHATHCWHPRRAIES